MRLRLVRPESEAELAKAAAAGPATTEINVRLEDELEGFFGFRCSFTGRDMLAWGGNSGQRRAWYETTEQRAVGPGTTPKRARAFISTLFSPHLQVHTHIHKTLIKHTYYCSYSPCSTGQW